MIAYLDAAFAESDPGLIVAALSDGARAKGKTEVAKDARLLPDEMSNSNNPGLGSVLRVLDALGLRLHVTPASST